VKKAASEGMQSSGLRGHADEPFWRLTISERSQALSVSASSSGRATIVAYTWKKDGLRVEKAKRFIQMSNRI